MEEIRLDLLDNEWENNGITHDRLITRGIVIDDEKRFYFVRVNRDDDFGKAICIETSGGGVEAYEDLNLAIKRELSEELGIEVDVLAKIGLVSDYYNLIKRHNLNHYFLCKVKSFGKSHMTDDEINIFHLSTLVLTYDEAINEYERCNNTPIGRLIYNREMPILKRAKELIDELGL